MRAAIFTIVLLSSVSGFSQQNELDKKYEPQWPASKEEPRRAANHKTAVLLDPTLFFRKIAALHLEHCLGESFSLQGAMGFSYGIDRLLVAGQSLDTDLNLFGSDVSLSQLLASSSEESGKFYCSAEARFYLFNEDYLRGMFFSFLFRRNGFDMTINPTVLERETQATARPGLSRQVSVTSNYFYGSYGVSGKAGKRDNIVHQLRFDIGFRVTKYSRYKIETNSGYSMWNTSASQKEIVYTGGTASTFAFSFNISYCIGLSFN
jgi:hypothetical protein